MQRVLVGQRRRAHEKCVGCKAQSPKKDKDAMADAPPKSALSNKSQQCIGATDPTKLQEEDAKTKQIAELEKELAKYKEYEWPEIIVATEKQLSNLKSSSKTNMKDSTQSVRSIV